MGVIGLQSLPVKEEQRRIRMRTATKMKPKDLERLREIMTRGKGWQQLESCSFGADKGYTVE